MKNKLVLPAFVLMVAAQLYIPVQMVMHMEHVLQTGNTFKFRTTPINTHEPLYSPYLSLSFLATAAKVDTGESWSYGEQAFVMLTTDSSGYAKIASISREEPSDQESYVTASIDFAPGDSTGLVYVRYPFDRYYMEGPKNDPDGEHYTSFIPDSNQIAYALVVVDKGQSVLKDVIVDGQSLREIVRKN